MSKTAKKKAPAKVAEKKPAAKAVKKVPAPKSVRGKPTKAKPYVAPKALPVAKPLKASKETKPSAAPVGENKTAFSLFKSEGVRPPKIRPEAGHSMYPFASMAVDDGFFVAADVDTSNFSDEGEAAKAQMEKCHALSNRLTGAVRRFTKRNEGYKFTVRIVKEPAMGVNVYRDA